MRLTEKKIRVLSLLGVFILIATASGCGKKDNNSSPPVNLSRALETEDKRERRRVSEVMREIQSALSLLKSRKTTDAASLLSTVKTISEVMNKQDLSGTPPDFRGAFRVFTSEIDTTKEKLDSYTSNIFSGISKSQMQAQCDRTDRVGVKLNEVALKYGYR